MPLAFFKSLEQEDNSRDRYYAKVAIEIQVKFCNSETHCLLTSYGKHSFAGRRSLLSSMAKQAELRFSAFM
ncbi:hypothetical protein [Ktedonobacter racemifer]|uniref:Uncharacterized protein n=1 Tax=Ktedonobacter racemifer DSM 44963 TaxID=485913 RepID=D6TID0_KTERA|nr:hypothetical protein [Ktedonobacter racemifer]EFH89187.1 hypothetical protein Krac_10729 [Ktedonobacter racemifer DSM 44963]